MNFVQVDKSAFTKKKRKLVSSACVRCHERKIKCDAGSSPDAPQVPCRNCLVSGNGDSCRVHADGRTKSSVKPVSEPVDGLRSQSSSHSQQGRGSQQLQDLPTERDYHLTPESLSSIGDGAPPSQGYDLTTESVGHDFMPYLDGGIDEPILGFEQDGEEVIVAETLHPRGNIQGLEPLHSPPGDTDRPQVSLDRFEAYVEDTLGSYAPSFRRIETQSVLGPYGQSGTSSLHQGTRIDTRIPESSPRGPVHPPLEVNMGSRSTIDLEQQFVKLDFADMEYLRAKGAFDLPPRAVQEDLVEAFFTDVHPTAPVINRNEFLSEFHGKGSPSRLLLFAIFTSGSRACRNPALLDNRGTNQGSAQQFYKATKALLDTGYESNRLVCVQALLLLTWWWDKKDDGGRNMRSCAVDAINTAHSLGMHRWNHYPKDKVVLVRIWKRIWWTCFNRDVAVAVSHGLPCLLDLSEFDVHPLTLDDFNEQPDVPVSLQKWPHRPEEATFSIEVIRVAEALHQIHTSHFVLKQLQPSMNGTIDIRLSQVALSQQTGDARSEHDRGPFSRASDSRDDFNDQGLRLCREWLDKLPPILRYDVDDVKNHQFWPAFIHILYLTNVMLRFRHKAVSSPSTGRAEAERLFSQARGIAAATMISKILRNARAHNHILRFTGQLTISLFNCLVFFLIEGQSPNDTIRRDAQNKYSMCLHTLYEFSQLWVSASLIHRLFETLQAHMQLPRRLGPSSKATSSQSPTSAWVTLPGLEVTSDINASYFRELINIEFYYDGGVDISPSVMSMSTSAPSQQLSQYVPDASVRPSPDLTLPLGAVFPESLDIEKWIDFFGLGEESIEDATRFR